MLSIRSFLFLAFIHYVSLQNVLVNENGQLFESFDDLAASLKTLNVADSLQTPKEQESTKIHFNSRNYAYFAVIIGSFTFFLGCDKFLCTEVW
jgi:hypothetical protein